MAGRDKAEKFVELANKRVNRAIKDLQLIRNLANRQNYEFTEDQGKRIIRALQQEVDAVKQEFQSNNELGRNDFRL